jgi:site-specific DNA-methyltransferase (adenine-specific)
MPSQRNKTIRLSEEEAAASVPTLSQVSIATVASGVYHGEVEHALGILPSNYFDLIIADHPYNYGIDFGNTSDRRTIGEYHDWMHAWIAGLLRVTTATASIYVCSGWEASSMVQHALGTAGFTVLNRITWKREKGRGAKKTGSRTWRTSGLPFEIRKHTPSISTP